MDEVALQKMVDDIEKGAELPEIGAGDFRERLAAHRHEVVRFDCPMGEVVWGGRGNTDLTRPPGALPYLT